MSLLSNVLPYLGNISVVVKGMYFKIDQIAVLCQSECFGALPRFRVSHLLA